MGVCNGGLVTCRRISAYFSLLVRVCNYVLHEATLAWSQFFSFLKARGSLQANTKKKNVQIQFHVLCKVHAAATSLNSSCYHGNLCYRERVEPFKRFTYTKQSAASQSLKVVQPSLGVTKWLGGPLHVCQPIILRPQHVS